MPGAQETVVSWDLENQSEFMKLFVAYQVLLIVTAVHVSCFP